MDHLIGYTAQELRDTLKELRQAAAQDSHQVSEEIAREIVATYPHISADSIQNECALAISAWMELRMLIRIIPDLIERSNKKLIEDMTDAEHPKR